MNYTTIFSKFKFLKFLYLVILFACTSNKTDSISQNQQLDKALAKPYTIANDSIKEPNKVIIDELKLRKNKASKPQVIIAKSITKTIQNPKSITSKIPKKISIVDNTIKAPKAIELVEKPILAGIPDVSLVKDAYMKDQNSQNFSSFSKLQGLKHSGVHCMMQDKIGNIWFGTDGGGVSKFDGKYFTHYTEKQGLCGNRVWAIFQDIDSNIWFGSFGGGISKFDGKYFYNFTKNDGLPSNNVRSIIQDKYNNLWFATDEGVCKYSKEIINNQTKTHFTCYSVNEGLSNSTVIRVFIDKKHDLWFTTDGGGVIKYDYNSFQYYTENEGLISNRIWSIYQDDSYNYWFGSYDAGLSKFDGKTFTNYTENDGLCSNRIWSILQDKTGNLWFGNFGNGISKLDGKSFFRYTENEGLINNKVLSILQDKVGNLWFGTYGGVSKFSGRTFSHLTDKEGLSNQTIISILQDKQGNYWFGTDGQGVSKFDGNSFFHYTTENGLIDNTILYIFQDNIGNLWFGSYGGACKFDGETFTHYDETSGLGGNTVMNILQDSIGNIWFGTAGGGITKYDGNRIEAIEKGQNTAINGQNDLLKINNKYKKTFSNYNLSQGLCNNNIWSLIIDKDGNLWLGTYDGGIVVCNFNKKIKQCYSKQNGLFSNGIRALIQDSFGNIWIGTYGEGVIKFDGKYFYKYSENNGLCNNFVFSILQDKNKNIWFGTRFGLSKIKMQNINKSEQNGNIPMFKNFSYEDGFLGIGCYRQAIIEDKKGNIWIGANDRLTTFYPQGEELDTTPPNIQLTNIDLFNEPIPWSILEHRMDTIFALKNGIIISDFYFNETSKWYNLPQQLSLKHSNNFVTFKFIGITQIQNNKILYTYKLDGIDDNWSVPNTKNEASYGNLPSGNYTFKIKAINSEGFSSDEYSYSFSIRPPWWKTWWIKIVYITLFLFSLLGIYKWRTNTLRLQQEVLILKVKQATNEIKEHQENILQKNEELQQQKEEIEAQKNALEELNKNLENIVEEEVQKNRNKDLILIHQSKHAAMGEMIGNIAHQWRQPLNAVGVLVQNIQEAHEYGELNSEYIDKSVKKCMELIKHMSQTINDFRNFFKENKEKTDFKVSEAIRKAVSFVEASFKNIKINVETIDELILNGYPNEMIQVIINILNNAKDALLEKQISNPHVDICLFKKDDRIYITISDNAGGIPAEIIDKIFNPYFTTKDDEKGTGLGLHMSKNIIEKNMNGNIFVNNIGNGAQFTIIL